MKWRHWIVAVCAMLPAGAASAQTQDPLSLRQAVAAALESQPLMRSARLAVDLAEKKFGQARAERFPSVRLNETLTHGNNPVFVFGSLLEQAQFGPQNFSLSALNNPQPITNLRSAVSTSMSIFDGMKTPSRITQADIAREQAVLQRKLTEEQVRFSVVRDYFGSVVAGANRQVAEEAVRLAESDIKRARDRLEAGLGVQSDLLAAEVQLAEFRQQQIQAEGNQATAAVVLNVSLGSSPQSQHKLTDDLVKKSFPLPTQDELVRRAMVNRPDVAEASAAVNLAERRVVEQRGDYLPELNVFGSFGSSTRNLATGSTDYAVGAGLTFNLFDAGRASRLSQVHIQENLAQTERQRLNDRIVVDVTRAYYDYRAAEQQLEVAEATLSQAAEALRIIQDRYEAGLTTITDVLNAETAFVRARTNIIQSRHSHYLRYAGVLLEIGELNDVHAFEQ